MYDSITERFFHTQGPWIKLFERFFCRSINNNNIVYLTYLKRRDKFVNSKHKTSEIKTTKAFDQQVKHTINITIKHTQRIIYQHS